MLVFKSPLNCFIAVPKCNISDAGESSMPERSHKVLPLSEKLKILNVIRNEKKIYAEVTKISGKKESSVKSWRRRKKFMLILLLHLKLQKLWLRCLISAWLRWKRHLIRGWKTWTENVFQLTTMCWDYMKTLAMKKNDTKLLAESKGWLNRFKNRFGLKKYTNYWWGYVCWWRSCCNPSHRVQDVD